MAPKSSKSLDLWCILMVLKHKSHDLGDLLGNALQLGCRNDPSSHRFRHEYMAFYIRIPIGLLNWKGALYTETYTWVFQTSFFESLVLMYLGKKSVEAGIPQSWHILTILCRDDQANQAKPLYISWKVSNRSRSCAQQDQGVNIQRYGWVNMM